MSEGQPIIQPVEWSQPAQEAFFLEGPRPVCASGGFNSTKTFAACLKILWLCDEFPKNRGVIARKVGKELRATTMATFRKLCPPEIYSKGGWNTQDGVLRLNNGSEILWLHLEDQEHLDIVRGLEINFFFIDQAEEIDEGTYDLFLSRLGRWDQAVVRQDTIDRYEQGGKKGPRKWRWLSPMGKPIPPIYSMLTCNPDTELHWIYRRFHPDSPEHQEKWKARHYKMFFFSTRDNKFLSEQNKAQLLANDPAFIRRYVDGVWGIPEGTIHVIPPESLITFTDTAQADAFLEWIRQTCRLHRTLDHGDAAPTVCGWFAVDRNANVYAYREYYQADRLVSYHRQAIADLSVHETYESAYADPSIFHKAQQKYGGRWCTADEYADRVNLDPRTAIQWWPADNNEMGTRNRINEYLRVDPERIHPVTKQRGAPRLFFVQRTPAYPQGCNNITTETRAQKRLSLGTIDGIQRWTDERNPDIPDHGYDCLSGDTPVLTRAGWRPIRALVGTVGEVWTLAGWQPYTECLRYRTNRPMMQVVTGQGTVACTPDHQFLTVGGWKPAWLLSSRDKVAVCNPWSSLPPSRPSTVAATTSAAGIFSVTAGGFIAWYGKRVMARSPRDTTSITSMETWPTTVPRILCYSLGSPISATTAPENLMLEPWPPCRRPPNAGTAVLKDARGIAHSISGAWRRRISETWTRHASGVVGRFVQRVARRRGLVSAISTAKWLRFASDTPVIKTSTTPHADSYCLTVPFPHAFAVTGGILVHNCVRYFMVSRPAIGVTPVVKASRRSFLGQQALLRQQKRRKRALEAQ